MRHKILFFLALSVLLLINCSPKTEKVLELEGTIVNSNAESILLEKPGQDLRLDSLIEIPIEDGKFYYKESLKHPEVVHLRLESDDKGLWHAMPLFLENEKMTLHIYGGEEFVNNTVVGGKLNAEYQEYSQTKKDKFSSRMNSIGESISLLREKNEYESEKMKALRAKARTAKDRDERQVFYEEMTELKKINDHLTPKGKILFDKRNILFEEERRLKEDYMLNNPSMVSYFFLLEEVSYAYADIDIDLAKNVYNKLLTSHPNHPYNELAANYISALENIKVGGKFTDFSAPDLDGNEFRLSDEINGKVALLDLWATWCGPCIAKTKTMVPVYNDFKDKGFTIVGVAGEFKSTDNLVKMLKKENWDWLQLVELDRQNKIWQKYGVDGGGGRIFLIDENGTILAKDPTAAEVRKELEARLN